MPSREVPVRVSFDDASIDVAIEKCQRLVAELEVTRQMVSEVTEQVHALESEEQLVTPAAACYAFMGFLMGQDPPVSFGRGCHVGSGISLAGQFCKIQGWPMPPEGFSDAIKPWK